MTIGSRRLVFASLVGGTIAILFGTMFYILSTGGFSAADIVLLSCFIITLPWTVIGFWNAVIGLYLMRTKESPASYVFPSMNSADGTEKITKSTALAMCIRNEDVEKVSRNLDAMIARLVASGNAKYFSVYVLSDTSETELMPVEEETFAKLRAIWKDHVEVVYRRREDNPGFKAGNLRDFCERWGSNHDFMLTLDADSVMSASAILRMVRIMQKDEKLGILQSLVVGLPSDSGFTRVFQFGMRLGMKSYTIGSAWWQADCGPYWGHNALIRLQPFIEHCHLPKLSGNGPLSGWILSHDQLEAVYMRRAGYECRVLADEEGSFEENPPHILEFIRRDLRWCHGNMQYLKLLTEPGLLPTSRIQLILAILMFVGSPAWMVFVCVATLSTIFPGMGIEHPEGIAGYVLFGTVMTMIFAPKMASFADVLMTPSLRLRFGGGAGVILSTFSEIIFSMMLAPIMAIANTIFLFKLFVLRKAKGWVAQSRDVEALPIKVVASHLWPQFLFGIFGISMIIQGGNYSVAALVICLPVFVGPLLAIPFGVTSSQPIFGELSARFRIWQIPEEEEPSIILRALNLSALRARKRGPFFSKKYAPLTRAELLSIDAEIENSSNQTPQSVRIAA